MMIVFCLSKNYKIKNSQKKSSILLKRIIKHDGNLIFDSGCVDERKSIRLKFNGYSTSIIVRVNPNCDGGVRTKWNFIVHCPEN